MGHEHFSWVTRTCCETQGIVMVYNMQLLFVGGKGLLWSQGLFVGPQDLSRELRTCRGT